MFVFFGHLKCGFVVNYSHKEKLNPGQRESGHVDTFRPGFRTINNIYITYIFTLASEEDSHTIPGPSASMVSNIHALTFNMITLCVRGSHFLLIIKIIYWH